MGGLFSAKGDAPKEDPEAKRRREAEEAKQQAEKERQDNAQAEELTLQRSRLRGRKTLVGDSEAGYKSTVN